MGKKQYLTCLFVVIFVFISLFAILGCMLIYVPIQSSSDIHQLSTFGSPVWIWVISIIFLTILGISCLAVSASSEKKSIFNIFAYFMGAGMMIMLFFGIIMIFQGNKFESRFDSATPLVAKPSMMDVKFRTLLEELQYSHQCCGVVSASDWGDNIPNSCECSGYGGSGCTSKPQGVSGPDQIYAQPCSKVMISTTNSVLKGAIGLYFGFAAIALLGLLVSILMIHQVRRHDFSGGASIAMIVY